MQGCGASLLLRDDLQRSEIASALASVAKRVVEHSPVLQQVTMETEPMIFLVSDRAPSTLKKHLCGWRRWLEFCRGAAVNAGFPSCRDVVDFLDALAEDAHTNQGYGSVAGTRGVMHALCFMVFKLGLDDFALILRGPIVCSWLSGGKWERRRAAKEATVVCELEVAAVQRENEDRFLLRLSTHAVGWFALF